MENLASSLKNEKSPMQCNCQKTTAIPKSPWSPMMIAHLKEPVEEAITETINKTKTGTKINSSGVAVHKSNLG